MADGLHRLIFTVIVVSCTEIYSSAGPAGAVGVVAVVWSVWAVWIVGVVGSGQWYASSTANWADEQETRARSAMHTPALPAGREKNCTI